MLVSFGNLVNVQYILAVKQFLSIVI
jgi:hypothetical protein